MKKPFFTFLVFIILSQIAEKALAQANIVQVGTTSNLVFFNHDSTLNEFRMYIQRNIDYASIDGNKIAKKNKNANPRIYVQLAITAEGVVTDVSILRPLQADFDAQVISIIQKSSGWENRSKQKVQLMIPVVFDPNGEYLKKLEQTK